MDRKITFAPAYDKRDPDPTKNYGIHGVEMRWILHGDEGAIQFIVYTGWHLPSVQAELDQKLDSRFPHLSCHPSGADVGYHSPKPRHEWQDAPRDNCHILDGPCYYDGSSLHAVDVLNILVEHGDEAVWAHLEKYYQDIFGGHDAN